MKYSKKFEKWYQRNYANRGIIDYGAGEAWLKSVLFHAWSSSAERVVKRINYINKMSDHNWQHEDVDFLQDYVRELSKDRR
jgi:hypothetical protein